MAGGKLNNAPVLCLAHASRRYYIQEVQRRKLTDSNHLLRRTKQWKKWKPLRILKKLDT